METWKNVPGYGNHYEASNLGRIRSKSRIVTKWHSSGKLMKQFYKARMLNPSPADRWGHLDVHISVNNKKMKVSVHRLVLLAFHGQCPDGMEGCHNDGNASNNRPDNLRWDTHRNNNQDRKRHGNYAKRDNHPMAKLVPEQVKDILESTEFGSKMAIKHGIGQSQVSRIRRGQSWVD